VGNDPLKMASLQEEIRLQTHTEKRTCEDIEREHLYAKKRGFRRNKPS
jgi:hypothetical protein